MIETDTAIVHVETNMQRVRDAFTLSRPILDAQVKVVASGVAVHSGDLERDSERFAAGLQATPSRVVSGVYVEADRSYSPNAHLTYELWKRSIESALIKRGKAI